MKDINRQILNELKRDCRKPLRDLSVQFGLSHVALRNKIKALENEEIISGYTARLDYEKLGFDVHTMIQLRIAKGKLFELEKKIANEPNVYAVYDTTGDFDCVLLARFKSTRGMDNFIKRLQKENYVERTNTQLILNTMKDSQTEL